MNLRARRRGPTSVVGRGRPMIRNITSIVGRGEPHEHTRPDACCNRIRLSDSRARHLPARHSGWLSKPGKSRTGVSRRKFAKPPRVFRNCSRPISGLFSGSKWSNSGEPTAPSRTASLAKHAFAVSSGNGDPVSRLTGHQSSPALLDDRQGAHRRKWLWPARSPSRRRAA